MGHYNESIYVLNNACYTAIELFLKKNINALVHGKETRSKIALRVLKNVAQISHATLFSFWEKASIRKNIKHQKNYINIINLRTCCSTSCPVCKIYQNFTVTILQLLSEAQSTDCFKCLLEIIQLLLCHLQFNVNRSFVAYKILKKLLTHLNRFYYDESCRANILRIGICCTLFWANQKQMNNYDLYQFLIIEEKVIMYLKHSLKYCDTLSCWLMCTLILSLSAIYKNNYLKQIQTNFQSLQRYLQTLIPLLHHRQCRIRLASCKTLESLVLSPFTYDDELIVKLVHNLQKLLHDDHYFMRWCALVFILKLIKSDRFNKYTVSMQSKLIMMYFEGIHITKINLQTLKDDTLKVNPSWITSGFRGYFNNNVSKVDTQLSSWYIPNDVLTHLNVLEIKKNINIKCCLLKKGKVIFHPLLKVIFSQLTCNRLQDFDNLIILPNVLRCVNWSCNCSWQMAFRFLANCGQQLCQKLSIKQQWLIITSKKNYTDQEQNMMHDNLSALHTICQCIHLVGSKISIDKYMQWYSTLYDKANQECEIYSGLSKNLNYDNCISREAALLLFSQYVQSVDVNLITRSDIIKLKVALSSQMNLFEDSMVLYVMEGIAIITQNFQIYLNELINDIKTFLLLVLSKNNEKFTIQTTISLLFTLCQFTNSYKNQIQIWNEFLAVNKMFTFTTLNAVTITKKFLTISQNNLRNNITWWLIRMFKNNKEEYFKNSKKKFEMLLCVYIIVQSLKNDCSNENNVILCHLINSIILPFFEMQPGSAESELRKAACYILHSALFFNAENEPQPRINLIMNVLNTKKDQNGYSLSKLFDFPSILSIPLVGLKENNDDWKLISISMLNGLSWVLQASSIYHTWILKSHEMLVSTLNKSSKKIRIAACDALATIGSLQPHLIHSYSYSNVFQRTVHILKQHQLDYDLDIRRAATKALTYCQSLTS